MLACRRCGQQGAALEVYLDACSTLAEELGGCRYGGISQGVISALLGARKNAAFDIKNRMPPASD
jgi:hypothetical protein